jgi:S-adenosylmethionine:tRNA ribosyltransferase-isomerase
VSALTVPAVAEESSVEATEPPEARGLPRDGVRLLAAYGDGRVEHTRFRRLPDLLAPGDLLVVNTSATLPAAVSAVDASGREAIVHLSTRLPGDLWLIELRQPGAGGVSEPWAERGTPDSDTADSGTADSRAVGPTLELPGGATAELLAPWARGEGRLWFAALTLPEPFLTWLHRHGRPIRYGYVPRPWPLAMYQTVFAREPGSAEMPSAARPFSPQVITELVSRGVELAPLVLHTGVSSGEAHESPYPERYRVPVTTARRVNEARAAGGRVIAVGTTVVRALETVADPDGVVHPGEGWTELVVTPARGAQAVDGLITGWHDPRASHLQLLEAVAGRELLDRSYDAARAAGYRWHEFGDSHLLLP